MNTRKQIVPYVPSQTNLAEFTLKAILLGLVMAVVLGAANAYLGLKAGLTISATFIDGQPAPLGDITYSIWYNQIRPLAVGAMLVGSLYTLWGLRNSIFSAFRSAFKSKAPDVEEDRLQKDINMKWILLATIGLVIPMTFVYYIFSDSLAGALLAAIIMTVTGFLFAGVGGWLVALVGGSNQPISGLALSTLIVAALLIGRNWCGRSQRRGCRFSCATANDGDMIQGFKSGTPHRRHSLENGSRRNN